MQTDPDRGGVRTGDEYDHKVKVGTKKYNVNGTEVEYKTAEGTMKESVQEVTFANKQVPAHGEIKITKNFREKRMGKSGVICSISIIKQRMKTIRKRSLSFRRL